MSNPLRAPREMIYRTNYQKVLASAPDAFFKWKTDGALQAFREKCASAKRTEVVVDALKGLDLTLVASFIVPKNLTVSAQVQNSVHQSLASAPAEKLQARNRSQEGKGGAVVLFSGLPEVAPRLYQGQYPGYIPTRGEVAAAMEDKFFMFGGAQHALGRLQSAYPRGKVKGLSPPTSMEVWAALRGSGASVKEYGYPASYIQPYPMVAPKDGGVAISINHNSDNGYPVLGKWSTPGASELVLQLASSLLKDLSEAPDVVARVRELEKTAPHLVTLMGKAKADYYSQEKIEGLKLRFYNVVPRQLMLIIQTATQPFDHLCRKLGEDADVRTAMGSTLVRRGGARLVDALQRQLDACAGSVRTAYLHVGDDSWLVVCVEPGNLMFMCDLDCSNFDLTQHGSVTKPVHDALRDQLAAFDRVAADLWYALVRERQVVVATTVVTKFKHGGPSGMPLQSKVNDILMEILLARVCTRLKNLSVQEMRYWECPRTQGLFGVPTGPDLLNTPERFMERVRSMAMQEAARLGFTLKVENLSYVHFPRYTSEALRFPVKPPLPPMEHAGGEDGTLLGLPPPVLKQILGRAIGTPVTVFDYVNIVYDGRPKGTRDALRLVSKGMKLAVDYSTTVLPPCSVVEFLRRRPFKFIGYYFHVADERVQVYCDLPRMMAQLPYPSLKWVVNGPAFAATEAMRVGSTFCSMGYPGPAMRETHEAFRAYVLKLVDTAVERYGDQTDPRLRWATHESPFGGPAQASLSGLRRAILDTDALWGGEPERPMPSESVMLPLDVDISALWADQMDAEEQMQAGGRVMEPEGTILRVPNARHLLLRPAATHPVTERNAGRPPPTAVWAPDKPRRERAESSAMGAARPRGKGKRSGAPAHANEDDDNETEEYDSDYDEGSDDAAYAYYGHDDDDASDFGGYSRRRK